MGRLKIVVVSGLVATGLTYWLYVKYALIVLVIWVSVALAVYWRKQ